MKNDHDHAHSASCSHAGWTRRALLGGSASLAAATVFGSPALARRRTPGKPVFVQVFLRGAMDGLTTVVPYGDAALYQLRPTIAVQPPGATNGALDLNGFFGLAPAAAPLLTPYGNGHLAIVHAAGSTGQTRSHFDAYATMELADPTGSLRTGWLSRYLLQAVPPAPVDVRAIGVNTILQLTLKGAPEALAIPNMQQFRFPGALATSALRQAAIVDTYSTEPAPVGPAALDTIAALDLGGIDFGAYVPENGAVYPNTVFGRRMRHTAALIKGDIGVEAVTIDLDGWDLHAELGPIDGHMASLLDELTRALEAFYLDMLAHLDRYVVVCLSEFGRRGLENASAGTDHGHGNAMLAMGGRVNGGQVIANWPGLDAGSLVNGDLAITIDYRDILGEILQDLFGVASLATIFPGHAHVNRGITT
jgi:uncharacterized protein (DUF1501 family)